MTEKGQNEAKKQYLNRYKNTVLKYRSLLEQESAIRVEIEGAKAIEYSDMPKGGHQTDLSDAMVRLERVLEKIEKKKVEMLNIRISIEERITDLEDGIQSRILYLRYIQFKGWEDICVEINYSWKQTHRLHSLALKNMTLNDTL